MDGWGGRGGRYHFAFFFAVDKVVVVLHGDEFVPAVPVGDVLERLEFPGGHLMISVLCPEFMLVMIGKWDVLTELAPMYLTHPFSTTSFNAFMISSLGVSRSNRWI